MSTAALNARHASASGATAGARRKASMRSSARKANSSARLSVRSVNDAPKKYGESAKTSVSASAWSGSSGVARRSSRRSASAAA